ncbi:MAG: hypothetical protein ACYC2O_14250 [Microthrixaceae bacterium]
MNDPSDPTPAMSPSDDPVLRKRERIRRLSELGSRIGYSCFGGAVLLFVVAFILDFPAWLVTVIVTLMAVGSLTLLPAIVLGYGVKAADAEDRGEKFGY